MIKFIIWLCILSLVEIGLALYLTIWREHFWNTVTNKQHIDFVYQTGVFSVLALCVVFVNGRAGYLISLVAIKWRDKLTASAWKHRKAKIENISQRVQEDCREYPILLLNLVFGLGKALVYVITFSVSLLMTFNWVFMIALISYAVVGTALTHYIALPLVQMNYDSQKLEATYRSNLTINSYNDCVRVMLGLAKKQKHLTYFQQFYAQVGVVLPLLMIAPIYFTTNMTLGTLMRFNSVSGTILDSLSYGINSFSDFNRLLSCRKRLLEAKIIK